MIFDTRGQLAFLRYQEELRLPTYPYQGVVVNSPEELDEVLVHMGSLADGESRPDASDYPGIAVYLWRRKSEVKFIPLSGKRTTCSMGCRGDDYKLKKTGYGASLRLSFHYFHKCCHLKKFRGMMKRAEKKARLIKEEELRLQAERERRLADLRADCYIDVVRRPLTPAAVPKLYVMEQPDGTRRVGRCSIDGFMFGSGPAETSREKVVHMGRNSVVTEFEGKLVEYGMGGGEEWRTVDIFVSVIPPRQWHSWDVYSLIGGQSMRLSDDAYIVKDTVINYLPETGTSSAYSKKLEPSLTR